MTNSTFQGWADTLVQSVQGLWMDFVNFIPTLVGALVVFLVTWIAGIILAKVTLRVLNAIQADRVLTRLA